MYQSEDNIRGLAIYLGRVMEEVAQKAAREAVNEFRGEIEAFIIETLAEDKERACNVSEAAELLGVSKGTIRILQRDGAIPFFKVGNRVNFRRADILEYRESRIRA
jgi:excisionase family DNA binding protein